MNKKIKQLKNFICDKDKKNINEMINEVWYLWRKNREFPVHYFTRFLYKSDSPHYNNFLSFKEIKKLWDSEQLHTSKTIRTLENKVEFNNFCVKNNIPTPYLLMYNDKKSFFVDNNDIKIITKDDFIELLKKVITKNEENNIFMKPMDGIQGKGCYRININDLDNKEKTEELFKNILSSNYIVQDTIKQHPAIDRINPYSINTIRVDTFIKQDGTVEILSALMRFGRKGSVVDNASSSGGFFIPLDLKKQELQGFGRQFLNMGSKRIYKHPDTKIELAGYKIPYIEEVKQLVKQTALLLGDRLTGWDIALTPDGPIVIEGNHNYHIAMQEIAYGGYRSHPVFKDILEEYI